MGSHSKTEISGRLGLLGSKNLLLSEIWIFSGTKQLDPSGCAFQLLLIFLFSLGSTNWRRNVAVGVAAGTAVGAASVAAAPALLTAAGFTAGGIAAGSIAATIQSVFYGGSVASGSFFALCQSAGAAGIGVAGNAAIGITGGITSGITALGAMMFLPVCFK